MNEWCRNDYYQENVQVCCYGCSDDATEFCDRYVQFLKCFCVFIDLISSRKACVMRCFMQHRVMDVIIDFIILNVMK